MNKTGVNEMKPIDKWEEKFFAKLDADKNNIGTENYKGLAYFWHHDYRHLLRNATENKRKKVHRIFLENNLPVDGSTRQHDRVMSRLFKQTIRF